MKRFGQYLMRLRNERGLGVREAARAARISDSYLSLLERGKRDAIPGFRILRALATVYGVDLEEMLMEAGAFFDDNDLSEDELIDQAYRQVIADPRFRHFARRRGKITTEAKLQVIEVYETFTGKKLLKRT